MSLRNKVIVFSGFRDASLTKNIVNQGGLVKTSLVKSTNILVYKKDGKSSTKISKAESMGIDVIDLDEFKRVYLQMSVQKATPKKNTCQYIKLSEYAKAYEKNSYSPPITVNDVEKIQNVNLNVGDIVNFGSNRDSYSWIVNEKKEFVSGSNGLSLNIPLSISKNIKNVVAFYKEINVEMIELSKNHDFIKKLFKTESDVSKNATFLYLPMSNELKIWYKNEYKVIEAPFTSKKIEAVFAEKKSVKIYTKVFIVVDKKTEEVFVETPNTMLKKLFGTKVMIERDGEIVKLSGKFDINKVKEKLNM